MSDRNGKEISVGDRCVMLDGDDAGKFVTVRKFKDGDTVKPFSRHPVFGKPHVRVDDGDPAKDLPDNGYTFSAWVLGTSLTKV